MYMTSKVFNLFLGLSLLLFFYSCNVKEIKRENDQLKSRIDSMEQSNTLMANNLEDIGSLIDSIELRRKVITINLEKGTSLQDHKSRLESIDKYVQKTNKRVKKIRRSICF